MHGLFDLGREALLGNEPRKLPYDIYVKSLGPYDLKLPLDGILVAIVREPFDNGRTGFGRHEGLDRDLASIGELDLLHSELTHQLRYLSFADSLEPFFSYG